MKVDKHITELLYEHDCVIIPNFGGFVANYAPAKIHPAQHTFTPPSKNISFNKHLKNNDGLLANRIATAEKTTYPEAIKYISHFTSATNTRLKKGEKVAIDEVGSLYLDTERNIQFEPGTTNYLLDVFGLAQFQSPTIKRDTITKRVEKELKKDRGPIPAERKKINIKRYVTLSVAGSLILAMTWITLKTDLLKNINYSNINPFAAKEASKYTKKSTEPKELKIEHVKPAPVVTPKDTAKQIELVPTQPVTAELIDNKTVGIVKADSTKVSIKNMAINTDLKFHLITGCFQIPENADRFIGMLQNQNITASIIGKRNGLLIVSSGDYVTRKEALEKLVQLKKSQPEAWLLVK